jgi:hypothetical protein
MNTKDRTLGNAIIEADEKRGDQTGMKRNGEENAK